MALASGAGGMRVVSGTFSVSHRPVGQVIFARRLARTYAVSAKSPLALIENFRDFEDLIPKTGNQKNKSQKSGFF
jgi:hypothetical protein